MKRWIASFGSLACALGWAGAAMAQDVGHGPDIRAVVQLVSGTVMVETDGERKVATEKMGLRDGDLIAVAENSWAVLLLWNGYLVRLDEEISIAVKDIVLIKEKGPPKEKPDEQLRKLLSEREYQSRWQDKPENERLAGWFVRRAAGDAKPVATAGQEQNRSAEQQEARPEQAAAAAPAPLPRAEPKKRSVWDWLFNKEEAPPAPSPVAANGNRDDELTKTEKKVATTSRTPARAKTDFQIEEESTPRVTSLDSEMKHKKVERRVELTLPEKIAMVIQKDKKLKRCLRGQIDALDLKLDSVTLRIKVRAQKVVSAGLDGGLRLPPCALKQLRIGQYQVDDGWYRVEVSLR
ncbi:MAG: hypothetical protein JXR83_05325 [Deltaproteobacteria bacterium]|nr:hypothetical protein [Deltaproteobacteria bacterium]